MKRAAAFRVCPPQGNRIDKSFFLSEQYFFIDPMQLTNVTKDDDGAACQGQLAEKRSPAACRHWSHSRTLRLLESTISYNLLETMIKYNLLKSIM